MSFNSAVVRITVSGMAEDIAALDVSDIRASIDASQLGPGMQEVEVALDLGEGIYHDPVYVTITITEEDSGSDEPIVPDDPAEEEEPDEGQEEPLDGTADEA